MGFQGSPFRGAMLSSPSEACRSGWNFWPQEVLLRLTNLRASGCQDGRRLSNWVSADGLTVVLECNSVADSWEVKARRERNGGKHVEKHSYVGPRQFGVGLTTPCQHLTETRYEPSILCRAAIRGTGVHWRRDLWTCFEMSTQTNRPTRRNKEIQGVGRRRAGVGNCPRTRRMKTQHLDFAEK
jgi:hypothetical protein